MNSAKGIHSSGRHPLFLHRQQKQKPLRFLSTRVDLNEDVQGIGALSKNAGGIKFLSQFDAVDALNDPEVGNLANELVALATLEMANQVPLDVLGKDFGLLHQLLDIVLAEIAMSVVVQFLDVLSGLLLAHGYNTGLQVTHPGRTNSSSVQLGGYFIDSLGQCAKPGYNRFRHVDYSANKEWVSTFSFGTFQSEFCLFARGNWRYELHFS